MNTYKIINLTYRLNKRDSNYNSVLNMEYVDQMERKVLKLMLNKTTYFTSVTIPLSLHKLRMKGLVSVTTLNEQELLKLQKESSGKEISKPIKEVPAKKVKKIVTSKSSVKSKQKKMSYDTEKEME